MSMIVPMSPRGRGILAILAILGVATARGAHAQPECMKAPASSLNGRFIRLGTARAGQVQSPSGLGAITKTIVMRDAANNPVPDLLVTLNFSQCSGSGATQEFRLASVQPHHPGLLTDCAAGEVSAYSDAGGVATFRVLGGVVRGPGNPPGFAGLPVPANACVTVTFGAKHCFLGRLVASAADQDLSGGVTAADLGLMTGDRLSVILYGNDVGYRARSDFDGDGDIDATDVGIEGAIRLDAILNGSTTSGVPECP